MKQLLYLLFTLAILAPASVSARSTTVYPGADTGENPGIMKIKDLEAFSSRSTIKTPHYDTSMGRGLKRDREWLEIKTTYETYPEWIDELTFQYYVMAKTMVENKLVYSMYKETVKYADIKKDRDHTSVVYLRPAALLRYGEVVAVAVEVRFNGKVIAYSYEAKDKPLVGEWWLNKQIIDSDIVTVRRGYLLDRASSPFAYINIDDYEFIKN